MAPPIAATTPSTAGRVSVARAAPSPDIELPLVPTVERTPRSRTTALEHLATAVILSERALVRAKDRANKTWLALTTRNVKSLVSFAHGLMLVVPALVPTKHWATIILLAQWLGPPLRPALSRVAQETITKVAARLQGLVSGGMVTLARQVVNSLAAVTCRILLAMHARLAAAPYRGSGTNRDTPALIPTFDAGSTGSLSMIECERAQDMDALLTDMHRVSPGMICAMASDTGAGKKRAMPAAVYDARQLGDVYTLLRQLVRGMLPGATRCVDDAQHALALDLAPYLGVVRPQAMTHDFIAESVAFVVWEHHPTTRLIALRRRSTIVHSRYVPTLRKLFDQLQTHLGQSSRDEVVAMLLAPAPTTVERSVAMELIDMTSGPLHATEQPATASPQVRVQLVVSSDPERPVRVALDIASVAGVCLLTSSMTFDDGMTDTMEDFDVDGCLADLTDMLCSRCTMLVSDCCCSVTSHTSSVAGCDIEELSEPAPWAEIMGLSDYDSEAELNRFFELNAPSAETRSASARSRSAGTPGSGWRSALSDFAFDQPLMLMMGASAEVAQLHLHAMREVAATDAHQSVGFVPALCDDGASFNVSCCRSADGAVAGSFQPNAEVLAVGDADGGLKSLGT